MRYRPEIDGLRALAVLPVIWFHAELPGLPGGFAGVDVFFVISGFLITSLILKDLEQGRFSLVDFYERRARRILPALVLVVACSIPFAWVLMTPTQMADFARSVATVAIFSSNIDFWLNTGYFLPSTGELPLLHTWSLAVEEQFYVIFPLLLMLVWRVCRGKLVLVLAGLAVASFAAAIVLHRMGEGMAAFYLLPTRGWELAAGALAAVWVARRGLVRRFAGPIAWLGLMALAATYLGMDKYKPWPSHFTLLPVLGTCALLIALRPGGVLTRALASPAPVMIGLISYSAYLWHQPVFAFTRLSQVSPPSASLMVALSVATLALAWLSWRFVEQPFRRGTISRTKIFAGSAVALTVLLSLGATGVARDGLPERLSPELANMLATATHSPLREACHGGARHLPSPDDACVFFVETPPSWAVLGDSHGVEISHALAERVAARGESLVTFTASGCPPALGYRSGVAGCNDWLERTLGWLETTPSIDHVVLVYRHAAYFLGKNEEPDDPTANRYILDGDNPAEKRALYWAAITQIAQRLQASGQRVTVLASVPELGVPLPRLVMLNGVSDGKIKALPVAAHNARQDVVYREMLQLSNMAKLVDPASVFCPAEHCLGAIGGKALYFDDDHLSLEGARMLVEISGLGTPSLPDAGHYLVSQPSKTNGNSLR